MFYTTKQNLLKDKLYKVPSTMKKAFEKQKYSISKQQKGERKTGNININITIITRETEPKNQAPNKKNWVDFNNNKYAMEKKFPL